MSKQLPSNQSIPDSAVIPVLLYPDVRKAVAWLCEAFGFTERLRIGTHRVQLRSPDGSGALVVAEGAAQSNSPSHSVMLRIVNLDALFQKACAQGAQALRAPETHVYGERQCTVLDPFGHVWTLTESLEDMAPASWGGELLVTPGRKPAMAAPVAELPVADVELAQAHYRDALGFEVGWLYAEKTTGAVFREEVSIFFRQQTPPFEPAVHWVFAADIDALHQELQASGARITEPLERKPWGLRQFTVVDLEGHRFHFHHD